MFPGNPAPRRLLLDDAAAITARSHFNTSSLVSSLLLYIVPTPTLPKTSSHVSGSEGRLGSFFSLYKVRLGTSPSLVGWT